MWEAVKTPVGGLLCVLVLSGVVMRGLHFDEPEGLLFDEHHFVNGARSYLAHQADANDHPPLGKLVLALSMRWVSNDAFGWRLPALVLGVAAVFLAGWAAARLFGSRQVGLLAAALVACDGSFIAYSRTALLDGQLVFLLAVSLLVASCARRAWSITLAGLLVGAACNVKFSGLGLVPLFVTWLVLDEAASPGRTALRVGGLALGALVGFVGLYSVGLSQAGQAWGVLAVKADVVRLVEHHAALTGMKHGLTSGWPTWFVPTRTIIFFREAHLGEVRLVTMLGNLATWWLTTAVFFGAVGWVLRDGLRVITARREGRAMVLLLSAALGFLAPWAMSHRDSYVYHYLPTYLALVLVTAGALSALQAVRPRLVLGLLCLITLVTATYAPLWCGLPLTEAAVDARLFWRGWR